MTLYEWSCQQPDNPTRFLNIFAFADSAARETHRPSEGVRHLTDILDPPLLGEVEFTEDVELAATR
jgi:quinol monooxygenase YgiN